MDSITIRKYKPEDHKELLRVFKTHFNVAIKTGITDGMKTSKVYGFLLFLFIFTSISFSFNCGLIACLIGISVHAISVWLCYTMYLW